MAFGFLFLGQQPVLSFARCQCFVPVLGIESVVEGLVNFY